MTTDPQTWHPDPSKPAYVPPAGAVDAHCHVFGPADRFPYAPERKYTPVDAPKEMLFALRDHLGFSRNVIVQASCHGKDNAALVDALESEPERTRGVAVVRPDISDQELRQMDAAGVRGIRFNFVRRLVDPGPRDVFSTLARRVADLGWHVVVYFEAPDLEDLTAFLKALPVTVVIDHMGRPDIAAGVESPGFRAFRTLMEDDKFWVKVGCPERLTVAGPPYDDVAPFARTLVESCPDRVLWGTDWPHPNMKSHIPDDGLLVDRIPVIAPTEDLQRRLLVDNPQRLYWAR
ncbi:amidohydrolase family protein [Polymorphum gilvum]|uniref:Metal-dependent hydrolase of the TIM-barrel fold family n=1 Tax=Polymorphum gilvum (strain LMG 25793 / CGMCC 1.9160 / SL003B-26A1) TaxID=991905 RepID=F2J6A1_POLGS|nr:amidohydrolase family protein [Polymorphum gilvum]ADZ71275.1 Metal-dependent hydrolase of the TIM-barrel fold family [Polymorphum gilvum SL003B-26A1]